MKFDEYGRREVARRLRETKAECEERGYPWMCDDLILALGYDHDYEAGDEIFDRLADLIDPTCLARADVEDTPDGGQFECWSCSVCGNILSSDPDYDTDTDGPTYCEVCGHRIIGKGEPTWL